MLVSASDYWRQDRVRGGDLRQNKDGAWGVRDEAEHLRKHPEAYGKTRTFATQMLYKLSSKHSSDSMKHLSTILVILAALVMTASGLAQEQPPDEETDETPADDQPGGAQQNETRTEFTLEVHSGEGEVYFQETDGEGQQGQQDQETDQETEQETDQQTEQETDQQQDQQQERNPDLRVPADTEITITLRGVGPEEHNIVVDGEASDFVSDGEEVEFTFTSAQDGEMEYRSENDESARGTIQVEDTEGDTATEGDDPFMPEDPDERPPEDDDQDTPAPGIIAVIGVFALAALFYKRRN